MASQASLQEISPTAIRKNPDNPRLIFREEEMRELLESIKEVGIKVPISLYKDGAHYFLIDGERRWRCAKRLNLRLMPAIVQPKPSKIQNLLMMFNIHNVRVDWDLMPMALKLKEVAELLEKEGKPTDARSLAGATGVSVPTVRRALDLLDLPKKYQQQLLKEALKPKSEQRLTADLFVEIYKSLHAVERHVPEVLDAVSKPQYIDSMVRKYKEGTIDNVVAFRDISKIARAESAGIEREEAVPAIVKLVNNRKYSIKDAFAETVEAAYERRDLVRRLGGLTEQLSKIKADRPLDSELREALEHLRSEIDRILRR